jgi:hypothetical protein
VGKSAATVALSADGAVVMVGGSNDSGGVGAAWVFTRDDGSETQDGKPADTGPVAKSEHPVASSAIGSIVVIDGAANQGQVGDTSGFSGGEQEQPAPSTSSDTAPVLEE